jgi:hypothetical protein
MPPRGIDILVDRDASIRSRPAWMAMEDWAVACVSSTPIHCTEHTHISHRVEYGIPVVFPGRARMLPHTALVSRPLFNGGWRGDGDPAGGDARPQAMAQ